MLYNISFKADNLVSFFNQIKNNDYDSVIMSHDRFGKIPKAELDSVVENLNVLKEQGKDTSVGMLKDFEKHKFTLQTRLDTM